MNYFPNSKQIRDYQTRETLALLQILALGNRQVEEGKVTPVAEVLRRLREKLSRI